MNTVDEHVNVFKKKNSYSDYSEICLLIEFNIYFICVRYFTDDREQ